jgi:hypothetical protein
MFMKTTLREAAIHKIAFGLAFAAIVITSASAQEREGARIAVRPELHS